jgi:hypothetical protein
MCEYLESIDNLLNAAPERIQSVQPQLDNLHAQTAAAKAEAGKPFPPEEEPARKTARSAKLTAQLDMEGRSHRQPDETRTIKKAQTFERDER